MTIRIFSQFTSSIFKDEAFFINLILCQYKDIDIDTDTDIDVDIAVDTETVSIAIAIAMAYTLPWPTVRKRGIIMQRDECCNGGSPSALRGSIWPGLRIRKDLWASNV